MLVKEVVALAAANMGREDLVNDAETLEGEPSGELASLLRCYNLVENEVALDYFPLKRCERLSAEEGRIPYSSFSMAPVNVIRVENGAGRALAFELFPDHLCLSDGKGEEAIVTYAYSPAEKKWTEESAFSDGAISARLLAFGVAGEFCLSRGQFSEASVWEKRYQDALRAANTPCRRRAMRSRRWA